MHRLVYNVKTAETGRAPPPPAATSLAFMTRSSCKTTLPKAASPCTRVEVACFGHDLQI